MATFYQWSNNGVWAVVDQPTFQRVERWMEERVEVELEGKLFLTPYPVPVFTFTKALGLRGLVTGTEEEMEYLLTGHNVVRRGLYVPFSNLGGSAAVLYDQDWDERDAELRFVTTLEQAMDVFRLRRNNVWYEEEEPSVPATS